MKREVMQAAGAAAAVSVAILGAVGSTSAATTRPATAVPALPTIAITSPRNGASYQRRSRVLARFRCSEGADTSPVATCKATVPNGHAINTRSAGPKSFTVTATDTSGHTVTQAIQYGVWRYVNPLRAVAHLQASRIDMGVDYSGSGPILAIGKAKVVFARDHDSGPERCWGRTCAPFPGGIVVYRLLDGPFARRYVYIVENI
ncbi:MAG: hypothetical protein JOZ73_07575, partial [Solirubrobacterales bacterium]|nr:hypothetical protein [Solirubrobacterales bacterium]